MDQELPMSHAFYEELARVVEANIEKEQFGANELVREVGLSRTQIHRKLKSITGQSISQFIREIRLRRAHELLDDQIGTASEIAYKVGFNSPTYFHKCFQDYFGYPPGSVKRLESKPANLNFKSRQLAAIMFTHIVGYVKLMGEDEQSAFELLKKNRLIQRPIIERFRGRWLKEIGDGVLVSFNSVSDAVYCAKEIQQTCENEPDLKLRIGIHEGEVVFEGNDVFGDGVNIASRLVPLAPIGGVLVSESVHKNVLNKKGIESTFFREEKLKSVIEPVRIYQVNVESTEIPEPNAPPFVASSKVEHPGQKRSNSWNIGWGIVAIILVAIGYIFYSNITGNETNNASEVKIVEKSIAVLPFISLEYRPRKTIPR